MERPWTFYENILKWMMQGGTQFRKAPQRIIEDFLSYAE